MPKFVSRSIKRKLTMITLLISCVVLLLASVIFVTTQVASYRRAIVQELETITTIIGSNSTAAVVFDDRRAAEEILAALRAKPNIVSARIFLTDGSLFATYMGRETPSHIDASARSNLPRAFLMPGEAAGHEYHFLAGHVDLYAPIHFDDETIGSIFIRSDLMSNAVKYTPEGGTVSVTATCLEGAVTISVADNGMGIAAHDIPRVLTAFGQVEGAFTRKFEGTGLGLPLAKSFAEAHGGSLALDSTLGVGTTVTIRFPPGRRLERDEIDPDRPGLPPPLPVRRLLRAKEKLSAPLSRPAPSAAPRLDIGNLDGDMGQCRAHRDRLSPRAG